MWRKQVITLRLAVQSLQNRRLTAWLTILSIAVSVALLIGVNRARTEAKSSFTNTISGADLIVGARGGSINLLLYSVFRIGNATNNMSWQSYETLSNLEGVAWTIPISLGDSHRGFRVIGTNDDYFNHYEFGASRELGFESGEPFVYVNDTVVGAEVATVLGYGVGDEVIIAHGLGATSFKHHDELPFRVTGVLKRTGTPIDSTVHITLSGIEAIHTGWISAPGANEQTIANEAMEKELKPDAITATIVGLESRRTVFNLQRAINEYQQEPLLAILPGVTLQQLWSLVGVAETALLSVSVFVIVAGLIGMLTTLLTSLAERRREMAVLRSVGAGPRFIFGLLLSEAAILTLVGALTGVGFVYLGMFAARAVLLEKFGIFLSTGWPGYFDMLVVSVVTITAVLIALLPASRAYRFSLGDGLTIRT